MTLIKIRMITYVRTRGKAFIGIDTVLLTNNLCYDWVRVFAKFQTHTN